MYVRNLSSTGSRKTGKRNRPVDDTVQLSELKELRDMISTDADDARSILLDSPQFRQYHSGFPEIDGTSLSPRMSPQIRRVTIEKPQELQNMEKYTARKTLDKRNNSLPTFSTLQLDTPGQEIRSTKAMRMHRLSPIRQQHYTKSRTKKKYAQNRQSSRPRKGRLQSVHPEYSLLALPIEMQMETEFYRDYERDLTIGARKIHKKSHKLMNEVAKTLPFDCT